MARAENTELIDDFEQFYRRYYSDEIGTLAQNYPNEQRSLYVDWTDLYRFDADLADDYLAKPEEIHEYMEAALRLYDISIDVDLSGANIRVRGLHNSDIYRPSNLRSEHSGGYIGIKGVLDRVTTPSEKPEEIAWECQRCGTLTNMPQGSGEIQEPYECQGCERQGPFVVNDDYTEWTDYCKVRIEAPPDESGDVGEDKITGYVEGDLVDYGHPAGLLGRAGEHCTVYGVLERQQKTGRNANKLLFDRVLRIEAIEFDTDEDTVDIEGNLEEFEALAQRPDAVDLFAESLVPELYMTDEWDAGLELAVAYLFAAPRLDIPNGPTYRGDIHVMVISDYGQGKSMVNRAVNRYSPDCIMKSATALSSNVGLLAAAVKDDFGEGQWTIKPGLLVRANGGHLILDEIDKPDADLARMNDALEGEQTVDVEKAGQSVTYLSRTGLWATGNPEEGRFGKHKPVSQQLGIKPSLRSRFDGILTMRDVAIEEKDENIAGTAGRAYVEAQEAQFGDREEFDALDRPVSVDVGRAWVAEARANYHPLLSESQDDDVKRWYASEIRPMNKDFADNEGVGADMPVPATARVVEATFRFSVAFARCHLRDRVADQDVDRAKDLAKRLVGQTFDGDGFVPPEVAGEFDQLEPKVLGAVPDDGTRVFASEIAESAGVDEDDAKSVLDSAAEKGRVVCENGKYWKP